MTSPFGLPPWLWVGISTFIAFVLGFTVMVEGIYRFRTLSLPPSPATPAAPSVVSNETSSAALLPPVASGTGDPEPLSSAAAAWIMAGSLASGRESEESVAAVKNPTVAADPKTAVNTDPKTAVATDQSVVVAAPVSTPQQQALSQEQRRANGSTEQTMLPQYREAEIPTPATPREQVLAWRRQNVWVILLVRYGREQEAIAERTWQRLRPIVPEGLSLLRVESHDQREWLLLLGPFPSQEAAEAAAQRLPPGLVVRRPHLQVIPIRRLF